MNCANFAGRIGADADLKYTSGGKAICSFSLAVDAGKDKEGERRTTWIKVQIWEKRAEALAQYLTKGKFVAVQGPVSAEAWTDKRSGDARAQLVLTVRELTFGSGGEKQNEQPSQRQETRQDPTEITDEDIPF